MNQADLLAEKVLDDILEETVVEMQRLLLFWFHMISLITHEGDKHAMQIKFLRNEH